MLQDKFLLVFLLILNFGLAQEKKTDTIYVYEEVIIHDTVYVEKPIDKLNLKGVTFIKGKDKSKLEFTLNGKKTSILIDSTNIKFPKEIKLKSWFFGGKLHFGTTENSFFKDLNAPNNFGFGLGVWVKKQVFWPNLFVGIGLDGMYWASSFSFDTEKNNSDLDGYYLANNQSVKLFQTIENKNFQIQVPFQIYYKIKKFTPSFGVYAGFSNYNAFFKSTAINSNVLDKDQKFIAQTFQTGYLAELQYEISKKIAVGITFSTGKTKNFVFTNNDDKNESFKTKTSFTENRLLLQLVYKL